MQNVRENYRDILASIAELNLLETILQEISDNHHVTYRKLSDSLGNLIKLAEYPLA